MELKGNLDSSSLQEILTTLAKNKQIGTLIVSDGESTKYIYFARAGVRLGEVHGLQLLRSAEFLEGNGAHARAPSRPFYPGARHRAGEYPERRGEILGASR
jgi:hypothetical protein